MSDKPPLPLNGRIVGLALAIVGLAVAVRVAWAVIEPAVPSLVGLLALLAVYRVMFGGFKR